MPLTDDVIAFNLIFTALEDNDQCAIVNLQARALTKAISTSTFKNFESVPVFNILFNFGDKGYRVVFFADFETGKKSISDQLTNTLTKNPHIAQDIHYVASLRSGREYNPFALPLLRETFANASKPELEAMIKLYDAMPEHLVDIDILREYREVAVSELAKSRHYANT